MQKNLVMSKKSSTFAPAFEKTRVSLAQLVEQLTLNQWVESSSLSGDTKGHPNGCPFSLLEAFCEVLGFVNLVNFADIHHAVVSWNVGL